MAAPSAARRTLGLVLIFLTAGIWIVSSFLSAMLVTKSDEGKALVDPFLLTYLSTSMFSIYLPFHYASLRVQRWWAERKKKQDSSQGRTDAANPAQFTTTQQDLDIAMTAAIWALPCWFLAQWFFNIALSLTSVTSNTILSSTASLFTFFLSIAFLKEAFQTGKLVAIFASIVGVALVTISDEEAAGADAGNQSFMGDALTISSALIYAGYTVVMRVKMPGEDAEKYVSLFFGFLGIFSTVLLFPVLLVAEWAGWFSLTTIPQSAYIIIFFEGLCDYVLSDYLWARAVILLGPTTATLGLSVQIPMAAGAELVMGKAAWVASAKTLFMTLMGTAFIMVGFVWVNTKTSDEEVKKDIQEIKDREKQLPSGSGASTSTKGSPGEHVPLLDDGITHPGPDRGSQAGEARYSSDVELASKKQRGR